MLWLWKSKYSFPYISVSLRVCIIEQKVLDTCEVILVARFMWSNRLTCWWWLSKSFLKYGNDDRLIRIDRLIHTNPKTKGKMSCWTCAWMHHPFKNLLNSWSFQLFCYIPIWFIYFDNFESQFYLCLQKWPIYKSYKLDRIN